MSPGFPHYIGALSAYIWSMVAALSLCSQQSEESTGDIQESRLCWWADMDTYIHTYIHANIHTYPVHANIYPPTPHPSIHPSIPQMEQGKCCSVWGMLPLAAHCHTHYHLHSSIHLVLFMFKYLVAKQHSTCVHTYIQQLHSPGG